MPEPRVLELAEFKRLVARGERPPRDAILRKQYVAAITPVPDDPRALQFAISTGAVDRDSDVIDVAGWQLANYRRNPVVLWSHLYAELPVARATKVWVEDQRLKAIDHFAEREVYPFADTVFQMVKAGYLSATSVGFAPLKFERIEGDAERRGGVNFISQELLEHSIVPVPSNPEALIEARSVLRSADWHAYRGRLEEALATTAGRADAAAAFAAWKCLSTRTCVSVSGRRASPEERDRALKGFLQPFARAADPVGALLVHLADPVVQAGFVRLVDREIGRAWDRARGRVLDD